METLITNELFSDFLQCKYRAYLKLTGRTGQESEIENLRAQLLQDYHARACEHLLRAHYGKEICTACAPLSVVLTKRFHLAIDVTATEEDVRVHFDALMTPPGPGSGSSPNYIPVIFAYEEKLQEEHKLLLGLCAWVLVRRQPSGLTFGRIVHGSRFTSTKIKLDRLLLAVESALQDIHALKLASDPPPLQLRSHCSSCEFSQTCRLTVVEKDDLTLLQGMKTKEIVKFKNKGIFTVRQLSYTFRPRKKSKRSNPKTVRNYHSLKALAIREKRIYVAGKPELNMTGTPVYLDVEGIPDRDFYYLIGLRIPGAGSSVQRSLWASDSTGEEKIWREFLQLIGVIENPQVLHYGSYETTFLRRMTRRYGDTTEDGVRVEGLIEGAQNVLSVIYGHIYFPTYSNGLKDIASFLGYRWSAENPSGQWSMLLRRGWELTGSMSMKQSLMAYNADDCEALELVVKTILQLIPDNGASPTALPHPNALHTDSLKPERPYNLGPVEFVLPELDHINKCAYWDYQRDRIYIRSNPRLRRAARKRLQKKRQSLPVNKTFSPSLTWKCPRCDSSRIAKTGKHSKLLYDLRFSAGGVKRWITKYCIEHYMCSNCGARFASDEYDWTRHRYGLKLLAYVIHNIIELHMPQLKLARSMHKLFGYPLGQPTINRLIERARDFYHETHDEIKQKLLNGKLIHADETLMSTKDKTGYVWVFTSMEEVIYLWSATREGDVARQFLSGFQGVLVSDFYSAYDSINCAHQRCLVHLIRDLNDDVLKEPFNEEMKVLVQDFAALLKPIVETIDRFGLKRRFLNKHTKDVARFYERLFARKYETEAGKKAMGKFKRNQAKLFTFLDYDDVPWNNNNAEHAIKAFSRLRNVIQGFTNERGICDYLMLLSICQTCEYRGLDFLDFLRSGENRIDEYVGKRGQKSDST